MHKKYTLAENFKITHTDVKIKYGILVKTIEPFSACNCEGRLCTCAELPSILRSVFLNEGKRKFVAVIGMFTSYKTARRLWALQSNHRDTVEAGQ